jgi:hypothetical protein
LAAPKNGAAYKGFNALGREPKGRDRRIKLINLTLKL